jgi:hypothetical protein
MTTHHGKDGLVKLTSNTVAETTDWSYTETADVTEDTVQGDAWKTFVSAQKSWTAEITARFDPTDTNGQVALAVGASVACAFYPEGATSGDKYRTGTGIVTSVGVSAPMGDMVSRTFSLQGTGALTEATVGA